MTANHSSGRAADDADLVRYLDGELGADETARIEAALASDAGLVARLETLRRRAARLNALLASADPSAEATEAADPVRKAGLRSITTVGAGASAERSSGSAVPSAGWVRAAAIVFALLGAALLVPPVRAWIIERLQTFGSDSPVVTTSSPEPAQPTPDPVSATIPAPGPVFVIDFDNVPAAGSLTVRTTAGEDALYEIESQSQGGSALVLPDGLRFQNRPGSASNYAVTLPPSVTTVRLLMDGRMLRTIEITPGMADLRIELPVEPGAGPG